MTPILRRRGRPTGACPFRPGSGLPPPHLAGRGAEQSRFRRLLAGLSKGRAADADVVLYGPRGNGKTALLGWLEAEAKTCRGLAVVSLTPPEIGDVPTLAARLLRPSAWRRLAPAEGSFRGVTWRSPEERSRSLTEALRSRVRRRGMIVLVDEAHGLDPEVGGALLNASQQVRRDGPFLLVLAGTPDLRARLRRMNASFWNRGEILPIGRLGAQASADAVRKPLTDAGMSVSDDALMRIVDESHGYPFFLQLWGKAVWTDVTAASRTGGSEAVVTMDTMNDAAPGFERRKRNYHVDRYDELKDLSLLPVASCVARAFGAAASLADSDLDAAIAAGLGDDHDADRAAAAAQALRHTGLIWRSGGDTAWEPGIPSLMDYVLEETAKGRSRSR